MTLSEGRIRRPEQAKNPGQFDAASYQLARGVHYAMFPEHLELTKKRSSVRGILQDLRRHLKAILRRLFGAEESAILEAMLLGESGSLSPDLKEMYRRMGIAHILAISGLHVSVLGSGLFALLKKLGLPHRGAALMAALLVTAYAVKASSVTLYNAIREVTSRKGGVVSSGEVCHLDRGGRLLSMAVYGRWMRD